MSTTVLINDFLQGVFLEKIPVIDVRSPKEFDHGCIPNSINLPLLKNEEREIVGTIYKKQGREEAVKKGFELVGGRFAEYITEAQKLSPEKEIMIYCWRGGMRSNIIAWVLNLAGFKTILLKGGYKAFRKWCLEQLQATKNIIVIGGKTGSGKTELLSEIKILNEQVIDLEGLAHHKGSAFGALGQLAQPTNEQFENLLAVEWSKVDPYKVLWLENESHTIGSIIIPASVFDQMRCALVVEINFDISIRLKRILNEYGNFPADILAANTKKLTKRLGGLRLKQALDFLEEGNLNGWAEVLMDYYDKTYEHSNSQRDLSRNYKMQLNDDNMPLHAKIIIDYAAKNISANTPAIV